jgi:hypothetical protein
LARSTSPRTETKSEGRARELTCPSFGTPLGLLLDRPSILRVLRFLPVATGYIRVVARFERRNGELVVSLLLEDESTPERVVDQLEDELRDDPHPRRVVIRLTVLSARLVGLVRRIVPDLRRRGISVEWLL